MESIEIFREWIRESKRIVFFGGAGVSTESGISDFRSVDGLYSQKFRYPPETMLSHRFFMRNTAEFFDFYRQKMLPGNAAPNPCHHKLAQWEAEGRLSAVVTQNIDGLHQAAGSKKVYELHGSVHRNYCTGCGKFYPLEYIRDSEGIPTCDCGAVIKPDVVLYDESLDYEVMEDSISAIANADLLIIGGTSLVVYPAAGFVDAYRGSRMVLVNKSETSKDRRANLIFRDPIGILFEQL